MVDYPMSFLSQSTWIVVGWTSRGDHSEMFLLVEFCCGTPPSCLKVLGGWPSRLYAWPSRQYGGGLQHFSVSPSPFWFYILLGLGWGWAKGVLGLRVWGQGLTILAGAIARPINLKRRIHSPPTYGLTYPFLLFPAMIVALSSENA